MTISNSVKKTLSVGALAVLAFASTDSSASTARADVLNVGIVSDLIDIELMPQKAGVYSNIATVNYNGGDWDGLAIVDMAFDEDVYALGVNFGKSNYGSVLDLVFAQDNWGASFAFSHENVNGVKDNHSFGLKAGFGMDLDAVDFGVAISADFNHFEDAAKHTKLGLEAVARGEYTVSEEVDFTYTAKAQYNYTDLNTEDDSLTHNVGLSVATGPVFVQGDSLAALQIGSGFNFNEPDTEVDNDRTTTWTALELRAAFEHQLNANFTARAGMGYAYNVKSFEDEAKDVVYGSQKDLTLGLGYHIANLNVDWVVNPDILANGPHWVSGNQSSPATAVSLSYTW